MERRRTKKINRLSGGSTYQDKKEIGSRCQNKKFFDSAGKNNINHCSCLDSPNNKYEYDNRFFDCKSFGLFLRKHTEEKYQTFLDALNKIDDESYSQDTSPEDTILKVDKLLSSSDASGLDSKTKKFIRDYITDGSKNKNLYNKKKMS